LVPGAVDVLGYPDEPATFGAKIRALTGGAGVAAVYDGVGRSTFDASLASLAVRGTLALYGASSGPHRDLEGRKTDGSTVLIP
jgi:NADPH2:quinone reductase